MKEQNHFRGRPCSRLVRSLSLALLMSLSVPVLMDGNLRAEMRYDSKNEPQTMKSVIRWIEDNTKYIFIYQTDVDLDRRVEVILQKDNIPALLDVMLSGTGLEYKIRGRQIILNRKTMAAESGEKTVSGIVSDNTGIPVIGASVMVKGRSGYGVITDMDGRFSITAPAGSVLEISCLGFKAAEITVGARDMIDIVLKEDMEMLDEMGMAQGRHGNAG